VQRPDLEDRRRSGLVLGYGFNPAVQPSPLVKPGSLGTDPGGPPSRVGGAAPKGGLGTTCEPAAGQSWPNSTPSRSR